MPEKIAGIGQTNHFDNALQIGRPPTIVKLFPNSKAMLVSGKFIDQAMLALSTYVGHARVTNTYWYLSGVPELMGLAAERFAPPVQDTEVNHV